MNSNKYTTILKKIFSIFCIFLVLATNLNAEVLKSAVSQRETPEQFDSFLKKCSDIERIALAQSIGYLPAIPKEVFGKLEYKKGIVFKYSIKLESYESYADSIEDSKKTKKPKRPQSFNELPPELVLVAVQEKILKESLFSSETIKKELLWMSHHWATYLFRSKSEINYADIVEWVAKKEGVESYCINKLSTYELSEMIVKIYFEKTFSQAWDKMSKKERIAFLEKIETEFKAKNENVKINNIAGIATGSAGGALAALSATISLSGFAFYTTLTSAMAATFSTVGVTLPFAAYMSGTGAAATLAGPVGWSVAATMLLATPFFFGWARLDCTERFIVSKYIIESSWKK